jgi:hypothetical protein
MEMNQKSINRIGKKVTIDSWKLIRVFEQMTTEQQLESKRTQVIERGRERENGESNSQDEKVNVFIMKRV